MPLSFSRCCCLYVFESSLVLYKRTESVADASCLNQDTFLKKKKKPKHIVWLLLGSNSPFPLSSITITLNNCWDPAAPGETSTSRPGLFIKAEKRSSCRVASHNHKTCIFLISSSPLSTDLIIFSAFTITIYVRACKKSFCCGLKHLNFMFVLLFSACTTSKGVWRGCMGVAEPTKWRW